ncbi:hypothetical protein [Nitratidesulfovibrio termitidis]|uniref:hypothetical protein n=1 Tax=Nitratidesulfovibrio termitidis TaxID=42252 RepID=UPI00042A4074|nr:hypothetical protein [Nitratidesulfovibrio termitidis]
MDRGKLEDWLGIAILLAIIFGIGSCQAKRMTWWQGGIETLLALAMAATSIILGGIAGTEVGKRTNMAAGILVGFFVFCLLGGMMALIPRPWYR